MLGKLLKICAPISLLLLVLSAPSIKAEDTCKDVLVVFARGSGQTQFNKNDQKETYAFINGIQERQPADVNIESQELIYPAVNFQNFGNAELEWVPGFYRASVSQGVANLQKLIRNTVDQCPNQKLVLGGYSQGAQVVAETLQEIGSKYHPNIIYAGLFGDPKFNPDSFAARGTFLRRGGVLEPYTQDFPRVLQGRISSWCKRGDGVCENGSLGRVVGPFSAHNSYPDHEIPLAANEAATLLQTYFPEFETKTVIKENSKLDLMLVFETSRANTDSISRISNGRKAIQKTAFDLSAHTRVGVVDYRHQDDSTEMVRTLLDLSSDKQAIRSAVISVDQWERWENEMPLYSALIEALEGQEWRPDAQKTILYVTRLRAQNPETETGRTLNDVIERSMVTGPVAIHPLYTADWAPGIAEHRQLAEATGGIVSFYPARKRFEEPKHFIEAVEKIASKPRAILSRDSFLGRPDEATRINLAGSYNPHGRITSVEWDLDNDGMYDATTKQPLISHVFSRPYTGNIMARITADNSNITLVKIPVSISSAHVLPTFPQSPRNLQISVQSGALRATRSAASIVAARAVEQPATTTYTAELSWDPPADTGGAPVEGYTIYGNGEILGLVNADTTNVVIRGVPADADLSVAAVNKAGTGDKSQPKTVHPPPDTPEHPPQPAPEEPDNTSNNTHDESPTTSPTNNETLSATPLQQQPQDAGVDDEKSQPALRKPVTAGIVLGEAAGKEVADISLTRLPYLVTVLVAVVSLLLSRHYYNKFYES